MKLKVFHIAPLIGNSRAGPPRSIQCVREKEEERRRDLGGLWSEFGLFACLTRAPKPSCPVLTGWHHHLLISSRSFHWLMDKAEGQGSGWQWGLGPVVLLLRLCLLSVVSEQHPINSQYGHSGSGERKGGKKNMGTKREQEEEVGKGEGRSDELSVAWEEGRAQGYDWLLAGSEFKANAQAPALCNGGRKGDVGHRKGLQTRKAGLGERKWEKKEKRRKKPFERILKCPDFCGRLFLQMFNINHKTRHDGHTL